MRVTHSVRVSVAAVTIVALLAGPIAPFVVAQAPAAVPPEGPDGGWPRAYTTASGAALVVYQPQVASWADQKHMVAYAAVSYTPKGAKQPALGTVKVESDTQRRPGRAARELLGAQDHRIQLSHAAARSTQDRGGRNHRGGAARRARDRARPGAGQHRHEPDHPEERGRREGGSAADLLQQDARGAGQHRRRADLGAHPAERSELGGQHQLGSLPARPDEDLLPSQRESLAESDRREGTVGAGRHVAGELREAAGRRELERREVEPPWPEESAPARCRRCSSASSRRS